MKYIKAFHKDVRSQKEEVVECGYFANKGERGSSYADVRIFWYKTHRIF